MSLDLHLGQRQEQRMALLPQMLQSIEVLQLATADLAAFVDSALEQNETLEVERRDVEAPAAPEESSVERDDSSYEEFRRAADGDADRKLGFLNNVPARAVSIVEHVREQLTFRDVPSLLSEVVLHLTERLDERGLLAQADAELAAELRVDAQLVAAARGVLMQLEPRGIGAACGVEAMLAQASGDPDLPLIERMLREHLGALSRNKLPDVARAMSLTLDELQILILRVRALTPRPGAEFVEDDGLPVQPDAFAWIQDGKIRIALDDEALPDLQINSEYAALAGDRRTEREVREYLRPKLRSARDLIEAIQQRKATLARVVRATMGQQRGFLEQGRAAIKPLRMSDIAAELELHTSTVSRTIAGKYLQTDRGVFALREFFDGGRIDAAPGEGQGRMGVSQQIRELVDQEDKLRPMSDDDLVAALAARGVQVARRTVAKYRGELGIASSYQRRKFQDSQ
ncbi:MAG: RNA polymerase factor sigma-54 [Planctomycetota bacterium]|nr:RNA polymerase factor sigma-54 [Planctomycetota bacterium]